VADDVAAADRDEPEDDAGGHARPEPEPKYMGQRPDRYVGVKRCHPQREMRRCQDFW
jgi:hypothetical protein